MAEKITAPKLRLMKQRSEKIVCVTAYDVYFGRLADQAGADVVLVGDSLGNVIYGYDTTVPVTLEQMVFHTAAVRRGVSRALVVGDLPFGSYQASVAQCVESSVALMKAGAEAVKLEGDYADEIKALTRAGIPVMGHLGYTPQSINKFGGHKVQGRGALGAEIIDSAKRLEDAGAFAIVLELIPGALAADISAALEIPTIGIGAGPCCDGQIQVMHDILGMGDEEFKHARRFVAGGELLSEGLRGYVQSVRERGFPTEENTF